ncbi:MAG: dipeptidase [Candidatus Eisenbacteria bacterium]|uniref:Dipeptidase n=1 Tax=Eiseniibacteriota bacterium TaxID=2212470 RepID=A0A7Y2E9Q2_UNCEI|nr:dipeptidase [Candidatus Eisenbacteria bacterium]
MSTTASYLEQAKELHREWDIFDAHVDTLSEMVDKKYNLDDAPDSAHLSWQKFQEGGLKGQLFACYVSPDLPNNKHAARVDELIDRFEAEVERIPDRLVACRNGSEIERALGEGKFAGMLSIEGGHAIEDSLDKLRHFYKRGVRAMTLTWNNTNNWADGCGPMDPSLKQHGGLTAFGRQVVEAMEDMKMAVDISHVAPTTFGQVIDMCRVSPFASHSSLRDINDHRRNLTNAQLKALAEKGGVLGVCFCSGFLMDESAAWAEAKQTEDYAKVSDKTDFIDFAGITEEEYVVYDKHVPLATAEIAANHCEMALKEMGTEHVSLGTDYDGARRFPVGLEHVGTLPVLTSILLARGWKPSELEGMMGKNLIGYFKRVLG